MTPLQALKLIRKIVSFFDTGNAPGVEVGILWQIEQILIENDINEN